MAVENRTSPSTEVLALVHDERPDRARALVGGLGEAIEDAGFALTITNLVGGQPADDLPDPAGLRALVVMGSIDSAYDDRLPWLGPELDYLRRADVAGTQILGVCFGAQALARALGGSVRRGESGEMGLIEVESSCTDVIAPGPWLASHSDVITAPAGARVIARNEVCVQAFTMRGHLGLQFHPEIDSEALSFWVEDDTHRGLTAEQYELLLPDVLEHQEMFAARCRDLVGVFLSMAATELPQLAVARGTTAVPHASAAEGLAGP